MANDCCGTLKVVAKSKETLERIKKILNYEDDEYFISRCRECEDAGNAYQDGENNEYWVKDFWVDGAWNCERFFTVMENKNDLICNGYEKKADGSNDYTKPTYGTAHITNLCNLAKVLDFGCELYSTEPGCCFCEHICVNHKGELTCNESADYEEHYEEDENGDIIDNVEPKLICGIENFNEFGWASEIYGE